MKIDIDIESGFCFGVTSAIEKAEQELQHGPLFVLGDIVHNGQEVQRLERLGLETIDYDDLRTLRGGRVLLRAHGEPPSTYRIAHDNLIQIIDATCPVVKRLQERIRMCYEQGQQQRDNRQILIFGKRGHAEVIGLQGQTNNTALVIENENDLAAVDTQRDIYFFSQTTKSVDELQQLAQLLQTRVKAHFEYHDTICRNVANRVAHLRQFATMHDSIIFVGGQKSSNAKVLYQNCLEVNPHTFFISSPDELTPDLLSQLRGTETIGICGATSTPRWLMKQCQEILEKML